MKSRVAPFGRAFVLAAFLLPCASAIARAETSVAVSVVSAAKSIGEDKIRQAVRVQLVKQGFLMVTDKSLARAAKDLGADPSSPKAAMKAGADLLVAVTVRKVGAKFVARGELFDAKTGRLLKSAKRSYKKIANAPKIGEAIGAALAAAASAPAPPEDATAGAGSGSSRSMGTVVPKDEESDARAAAAAPAGGAAASPASKTDKPEGSAASVVKPRGAHEEVGEHRVLRLALGGGSQLASAYTVSVGSRATGLAYRLSPLVLLEIGAHVAIPDVGVAFELGLGFVPVKYTVDVTPAVDPRTPGGRFLDLGATALYEITVASLGKNDVDRLFVAPLLGVHYSSLSVDAQAPFTVVVSSNALAPSLGARLGLSLGELAFAADLRINLIVSYSEQPEQTGQDGGGLGIDIGATGRYWVSSNFGFMAGLDYAYARVSLSGQGTRTPFLDDPVLQDATVFSGSLKTRVGVVLAL